MHPVTTATINALTCVCFPPTCGRGKQATRLEDPRLLTLPFLLKPQGVNLAENLFPAYMVTYKAVSLYRTGCLAPQSHPVIVYLNGERYGKHFVLTEHLNDEWLKNRFGHDDFVLIRTTGHVEERNRIPEWREFKKWARDNSIIKTMDTVSERVDIENMSRWFLSQFFTAGNDMYQGPLVKSKIDPEAKWFWINWDMDQSFRNPYEPEKKKSWEQKLNFHNVIRNPPKDRKDPRTRFFRPDDPRSVLFREMHKNDPRFRKYFEALFMEVMNHRLNPEFLQEWVEAQRTHYRMCGFHMDDFFDGLAEYMVLRPGYLGLLILCQAVM